MNYIPIIAGDVTADAGLNDSRAARAILAALPITARANTWGDLNQSSAGP